MPPCSFCSEASGVWARRRPFTSGAGGFAFLFSLIACVALAPQSRGATLGSPLLREATPQHRAEKNGPARTPPRAEAPSPYRIEWLVDINDEIDLKQVWQMLNLAPPGGGSYRCGGHCEAETFDLATADAYQQKTVALRLSYDIDHFYQYLIFKQTGPESPRPGEWQLLGSIDCFDQQNAPPAHRLERGDQRAWLVIKESLPHGPGTVAYREVWYELQAGGLKRVLAYPVEGSIRACRGQIGRSYKSLLLRHDMENGAYTIPVQLMIAYEAGGCNRRDDSLALFAKGQKIYYVWQPDAGQFVLDEARSELSQKQIDRLYDAQRLSDEAFVEDNFEDLVGIAKSGDAGHKAWLKSFAAGLQHSARRAELLRLLQQ